MARKSGILLPIFSLPSPYGIGTLGKSAYEWVDFLASAHQALWQVLPIGPTSYGDSPYQSFSAFAGNPYFIDLDMLCEQGFLTRAECDGACKHLPSDFIDYAQLYQTRIPLLRKAFSRFADFDKLAVFVHTEPWVEDYARFMAVKTYMGGTSWQDWPEELRHNDPKKIKRIFPGVDREADFYVFLQFLFFDQWDCMKQYANQKGISIVGDLPIYVALDSADVWSVPENYLLDPSGHPIDVAGCPPDAFARTGQLWGNPLYRWDKMHIDHYAWWIKRLRMAFRLFDVVRIDHFRGFESYYAIPAGDKTAENGEWRKGPGMDFIHEIQESFPSPAIIAEDLGYLTPEVRALLQQSGFPGMKVLQFAFDTRESSNYLPHTYSQNCVVYTGTHDNDTTGGWLHSAPPADVAYAKDYLQCGNAEDKKCVRAFIIAAMASVGDTVIIPFQDWLGLGTEARINEPSTLGKNWRWRTSKDSFSQELAIEIAHFTHLYAREK